MDEAIIEAKKQLRQSLRERRALAAKHGRAASLSVRDIFLRQFSLPPDSMVAFYMAQPDEIDPTPLIEELCNMGHGLCLPVVDGKGSPLVFRSYCFGDPFRLGPMRIPEPQITAPLAVPDVLLVPLVGFDRKGNRLGQGGGFYDLTIKNLRAQKRVIAIGLAFSIQEESSIPVESHDSKLDAVVTEQEAFSISPFLQGP